MITIARIDERLIHGQVAYAWTVAYKSEAIMVIDNEIEKDKFQISLLQMACPSGVKCFICDEEKAVELLNKYEKRKIFVVVKHPATLLSICGKGIDLKAVNVGGLYFKEGRRQLSKTVYVDKEMEDIFRKLDSRGVRLENRTTPTDAEEDLMRLM